VTAKPYRAMAGGVRLAVRLTPRAGRDRTDGVGADADGHPVLRIRLGAPPVDGAANDALIAFLAKALEIRKKDIVIQSGQKGRTKILEVSGDPDALIARLESLIS